MREEVRDLVQQLARQDRVHVQGQDAEEFDVGPGRGHPCAHAQVESQIAKPDAEDDGDDDVADADEIRALAVGAREHREQDDDRQEDRRDEHEQRVAESLARVSKAFLQRGASLHSLAVHFSLLRRHGPQVHAVVSLVLGPLDPGVAPHLGGSERVGESRGREVIGR